MPTEFALGDKVIIRANGIIVTAVAIGTPTLAPTVEDDAVERKENNHQPTSSRNLLPVAFEGEVSVTPR
jgi:hypothetical protein